MLWQALDLARKALNLQHQRLHRHCPWWSIHKIIISTITAFTSPSFFICILYCLLISQPLWVLVIQPLTVVTITNSPLTFLPPHTTTIALLLQVIRVVDPIVRTIKKKKTSFIQPDVKGRQPHHPKDRVSNRFRRCIVLSRSRCWVQLVIGILAVKNDVLVKD